MKIAIYVLMTNVVADYSFRKGVINAKTFSSKFEYSASKVIPNALLFFQSGSVAEYSSC